MGLILKSTMPPRGGISPSVARSLSEVEARDLAAIAGSLPGSWVAQLEPPYGQLAITPRLGRRRFHRCWVASGAERRIFHDSGVA